ncbi:MAG: serine/threonine protein kinase [Polyangia bacterium]
MPGPTRFGKYDLLALLATGGMAEIWLAKVSGMAGFEKLVVIKRLLDKLAIDPEYVEMFLDEARINARLTHSNIVQVLELGQVEGKYFMAMEFVPGLSVSQVGKRATKQLGSVPQEVACGIVAQACSGLHYAHEKTLPDDTPLNIIHRDVSPQNLILTYEGLVKVLDFGIAKSDHRQSQTRTGLVKGKFSYMSPEQCLGQALDRRNDVFALGIVLFELCTARRLFKRGSTYETYTAITNADVPPPRSLNQKIPEEVEAVIKRALAKKKDDRYPTADAMQDALEDAMRKASLRGSATDLAKFMNETFAAEEAEQRRLIAQAQRGELGERGRGAALAGRGRRRRRDGVELRRRQRAHVGRSAAAAGRGLGAQLEGRARGPSRRGVRLAGEHQDARAGPSGGPGRAGDEPGDDRAARRAVAARRADSDDLLRVRGAVGGLDRADRVADRALV